MIRVRNQKVITRLSQKTLKANRVRNLVAVFAIALTTTLFMASVSYTHLTLPTNREV